ncbi:hypothetical protein ACPV3P_18620 [Photobacterium damselae]|uniref:hypothetical protein n=1 Tax=Photobacterium damselae TaxID=38293 RepID=UPI0040675CCB
MIKIEKKQYKNFLSPRALDSYKITAILLIIRHSTSSRARYIYLDKLYFLFDLVICDQKFSGFPKFTIPPWDIDKDLKNKIIVLVKNGIIEQSYDKNKVRYSLTEQGSKKVIEIQCIDEFSTMNDKIKTLANDIKTNAFEKSRIIFNV